MKSSYLLTILAVIIVGGGLVWYVNARPQQTVTNIPVVQSPTSTAPVTQATSTPAQTSTSTPQTPNGPAPKITNIAPTKGPAGTTVTINGTGFDKNSNFVLFGNSNGRHHPDGSPDNSRGSTASSDGKTLTFQIPNSGPSGILCDASNHCVGIAAILLSSGSYKVAVKNANGTSNAVTFGLTK
jgi:cytoskeletal protein RodZ